MAAKKSASSSPSVPSTDAAAHGSSGENGPSIPFTDASRISGENVPLIPSTEAQQHEGSGSTPASSPPILPPPPPSPPPVYSPDHLPQDPADRLPIASYPINDQDAVRRAYIMKGPNKPCPQAFAKRKIGTRDRSFNIWWFHKYHWLEYSIKNDAAFCFVCFLFKKGGHQSPFTNNGWRNWNRDDALDKHVGKVGSLHNAAQERYISYLNPSAQIDDVIVGVDSEERRLYKIRLTYSLRCLRFLLNQGLAFRGHDESEESKNRGNFLELLKWLASNNEEVDKYVLNNAPRNCTLTCSDIQKEIIQCCAMETRRKILEDLGDDHYCILADEATDVSHRQQLAVCLRYVDKLGRPCEHFLGIVHVEDTTSLTLKNAIQDLLVGHHLTITQIRGQGYDGASNMRGEIKGLKTLFMKDSPSAYYVHCFAHQLQLVLVGVAKGNDECEWFFDQVTLLLSIVASSCKRHDMLRNVNLQNILKAIEYGEIHTGQGLNQEMGLARPGDTRWGSHYKTVVHIISMYPSILDVLVSLGNDVAQKTDWPKIRAMVLALESFDFIFSAHLMVTILGYTNELSLCLQRREQDILNALSLVSVAKNRMQQLRANGWVPFLQKVTLFCNQHGIQVPEMDANYVPFGRSPRHFPIQTNDDRFRRQIYIGIIDHIIQELDTRFDEVNMELLSCMTALNPSNSFASFDAIKVRRLAEFYPNDFSSSDLIRLEMQLDNYIDDMRREESFLALNNIVELSVKLVETKRDIVYDLVYLLIKLALILPVATASVERAFSAMNFVKNDMRNRMGDDLLDDCLVTFIEREIFFAVEENDIIESFMSIKRRRPDRNRNRN
ncbi:hypothetical protein EJB05_41319, partial [Eragrostis curvula]